MTPDERPRWKKVVCVIGGCEQCEFEIATPGGYRCRNLVSHPETPNDGFRPDCPLEDA